MILGRRGAAWLGLAILSSSGCTACSRPKGASTVDAMPDPTAGGPAAGGATSYAVAEVVYDGALKAGWHDGGYASRDGLGTGPAKVRFSHQGVFSLDKPGLDGSYGGVIFRMRAPPAFGDFIELRVESSSQDVFPRVRITDAYATVGPDGWSDVVVPMTDLDPKGAPFDRIVLRAFRDVGDEWILLDKVSLTKGSAMARQASYDVSQLRRVTLTVDCAQKATAINPSIYGMAYYPFNDGHAQQAQWLLEATARRWGGNPTSTFNWQVNAWNTGNDWFFENHGIAFGDFVKENVAHKVRSVVTVPIMGWIAKDDSSGSFPVSVYGPQEATDGYHPDYGNGKGKDGRPIKPTMPPRAYVQVTPAMVKGWVETLSKSSDVHTYILDNEPGIWSTTHRDAHPEPTSYDELVKRTIDFGTAVREADPQAVIAGPAEWGWTAYNYSAKDLAEGGTTARPDRRVHGDLPVIAYYLKSLAEEEKRTGVHILDVLDLHSYPYGFKGNGDSDDPATSALRLRMTRMLWDPTYVDESWVNESIMLLPRMRDWIAKYYPGRGMSIGEWNFSGEKTASGGLAVAEALGRYAQFGVTSAYYWTYPPENTPAMWAFRAYRDFDGKGGHFLEWYTPTRATPGVSLFASRDESGKHLVVVALNFSPDTPMGAVVDVASCGAISAARAFTFAGDSSGFVTAVKATGGRSSLLEALAPYSINVYDIELNDAVPLSK